MRVTRRRRRARRRPRSVFALRKPTRPRPDSSARRTASDDGAPMATSAPTPATAAFWTSSNPMRPLTSITARRGEAGEHARTDHLVEGVVPTDVLTDLAQGAVGVHRRGGVQASGGVEDALVLAEPVRQGGEQPGESTGCAGAESLERRAASVDLLDALGAADAAGRGRRQQGRGAHARRRERRRGQGDGDDVELLLRSERHVGAVGDLGQRGPGQHALARRHPGGQLEVVARCASRRPARHGCPGQARRISSGSSVASRSSRPRQRPSAYSRTRTRTVGPGRRASFIRASLARDTGPATGVSTLVMRVAFRAVRAGESYNVNTTVTGAS